MGLPVELGDVPSWIGAATGAAALFRGLSKRQQTQARDWGEMLDELSDLEPEELQRIVEDNPAVAEVVGLAAEEAARTASDHKRYLLAQVAAAALSGATTPEQVEALRYLARTVIALDSADITMLVIIGTTADREPRAAQETAKPKEIEVRWPGPPDLVAPALAALQQQGLLEGVNDYDGKVQWRLSPYGRRFLDHLLTDLGGWPPRQQLEGG